LAYAISLIMALNQLKGDMKRLLLLSSIALSQLLSAQNLIENGDFELGNLANFTSHYKIDCGPQTLDEGAYCITDSTNLFFPWSWSDCNNKTTGGKKMMAVNGATTANEKVWCYQVTGLKKNTYYKFSTYLASVIKDNPAKLQFSINDNPVGNIFTASDSTCKWNQFYELWNSGNSTTANICIVNQNTISNGNDFALDDISFVEVGLTMPNVFTPNGDGENETFHPFVFKEIDKYDFVIYDRWGIKVYEQKEDVSTKQPEWNGKLFGTGGDAASGTYYWILNYETSIEDLSAANTLTGYLTLIR